MMRYSAIVVQLGARHQYAMPAALSRAGMLEAFYTDACSGRGVGRFAEMAARTTGLKQLQKFAARRPPPDVLLRTRTFESWGLEVALALRGNKQPAERARQLDRAHRKAGERMIAAGFGRTTHVLSMFGEGRRFLVEARERGLTVVSDVNIALSAEAIVMEEQRRYPDWESPHLYWGETLTARDSSFAPTQEMLTASQIFLCPSEFVRDDLVKNFGVSADRTRLVPYAVNPRWFAIQNEPVIGRVLFAGAPGLRKGIHILAEAANLLRARGRRYEFQVMGGVADKVRRHPCAAGLTFVGSAPLSAMREHYERADVFALPALAEGSAGVTYEALGAGVPVITTKAAGSVVRDGIEGRIVAERDPEALANAIEEIVEDRSKRARLAAAARARAQAFSWDAFQERLVRAMFDGFPAESSGPAYDNDSLRGTASRG